MSSILHFLRQALVPALSLWLLATPSHATPVFEPVQGFVRSPENPQAKLIQASDGDFYGTTANGGTSGYGTVFKMTATGTLTTLVNFNSTNGSRPQAGLLQGSDGNFYGTTREGGSSGYGTVFKMTAAGALTTLVNFNDSIGFYPQAGLVQGSDGNFYGTTYQGGSSYLYGTVFKMTSSGTLTTLVNFTSTNGSNPTAGLVQGSDGNFYGTTYSGGSSGYGTVFKMTATGTLTTLVNFTSTNGGYPKAGLVQGSDGNFYATTSGGGSSGYGTVFKMTPTGTLTTLRNFTNTNGRTPYSDLVQGSDGNFYGTTREGGSSGYGTVFKMTPTGTLTTLVNFTSSTTGSIPNASGLVQGTDGNFYGTTVNGGTGSYGTVFKMTVTGTLTTLVNFTSTNGRNPYAGLVQGSEGNFYGTTLQGGSGGQGTVFKMTPSGSLTTLVNFVGANGSSPSAAVVLGNDGNLYGTTSQGGSGGYGTVFKMTATGTLTTLVNFTGTNGSGPQSALVLSSDGYFYGTTSGGGMNGWSTVFKMSASGILTTLANFDPNYYGYPLGVALVQGSDGNFYGTTRDGGSSGRGTVFKMTSTGTLTTLVNFSGTNGSYPVAALVRGSAGNFFGTTSTGGVYDQGTVFKVTTTGTLTTLVNFTHDNGSTPNAGLLAGSDGNFYGTTFTGGSGNYGTVFKMTTTGTLTSLVNFSGSNGSYPFAALVEGSDGNLYGTTREGGSMSDGQPAGGGQIFRLRMGPAVLSQVQMNVSSTSATLNGTVNPGGYATLVSFQYGTNPTLETSSTASAGTLAAGISDIAVQASVSGLQPSTLYYYRVLASNVENTVPQYGSILSFTTANTPQTITFAALSDRVPTSPAFSLSASASSSLPVSFALVSGPATLLGSTVTLTGAPGTVIIRASQAGNGSYSAAPPIDRSFTVAASTVLLTNWTTSAGLSGANAAPDATPFNDGIENLLKYAFNMNAAGPDVRVLMTSGAAGLPQIAVDSSGAEPVLKVEFLRRKGSGLIYTPQRSNSLGSFVGMAGAQTVTSINAQWERVTVEEPAPPATAPSAFARVQVSLP